MRHFTERISNKAAWTLWLAAGLLGTGCSHLPAPRSSAPEPVHAALSAAPEAVEAPDPGPSDLSLCMKEKVPLVPAAEIDVRDFASRLHGTWELSTRTIQGLTIDTNSLFYFDIDEATETGAAGTAMMIDYGNLSVLDPMGFSAACRADATVAALWKVRISRSEGEPGKTVSLVMDGQYFGSYGDFQKGITATEQTAFMRRGDEYLSGGIVSPAGGQGMPDDVWDRVGLSPDTLTYVSCAGGFIDRYVKRASGEPRVDGMPLAAAWEKRVKEGSILVPIPVEPGWSR